MRGKWPSRLRGLRRPVSRRTTPSTPRGPTSPGQVQRIGCPERPSGRAQEKVLRPAMHVTGQLDAPVRTLVEAPHDGLLHAMRRVRCERALMETPRQRGHDLGQRQIGHEEVDPPLHRPVERIAVGLGQVELEQGAGVAVEGPGQPRPVAGAPLAKPRRTAPPRGDPRGPPGRSSRAGDRGSASCGGTPRGLEHRGRAGDGRHQLATGYPRSVITTSRPFLTSSRSADRFCRASRTPAVRMAPVCYM